VHLWIESREVINTLPVIRGRASAVDSDHSVTFDDFDDLQNFMLRELEGQAAAGPEANSP